MAGVDWLPDMTARWVRILSAAGGRRTPLDEAVDQINSITGTSHAKARFGRLKRPSDAPAEAAAVTTMCRLLIAGVLVGDVVLSQLCALRGETRQQVLGQLTGGLPGQLEDEQLRALQVQLSEGSTLLRDAERPSFDALGTRIGQVLKLAEEQASAIVDEARLEAAEITAAAGTPQPCPHCGAR